MRIWLVAAAICASAGLLVWALRRPAVLPSPAPNPPVARALTPKHEAIDRGLAWLASAQEADGHWWCARWSDYKKYQDLPGVGEGAGDLLDPALTALALLPFLYDGNTSTKGRHAAVVGRALGWLRGIAESYVAHGPPRYASGGPGPWHWGVIAEDYNPVAVYAALAEALRTGQEDLRPLVEAGVRQMLADRRKEQRWASTLNTYDIGAVVFWVELLETAEASGISVPASARGDARAYLREMTEESSGRILSKDVCKECLGGWDAQCVAILTRAWIDPGPDPLRDKELDTIAAHAPVWEPQWKLPEDPSKGPAGSWSCGRDIVNYYYWYYGTLAMERHGGARREPWRKALLGALLPNQVGSGEFAGSWEAVDPWGRLSGRVYSTAYAVMSLLQLPRPH